MPPEVTVCVERGLFGDSSYGIYCRPTSSSAVEYQLETGYSSVDEAREKAQVYVNNWPNSVFESEPDLVSVRNIQLPRDCPDLEKLEVDTLAKSLQDHLKAPKQKLERISEGLPLIAAMAVLLSFIFNVSIPFLGHVPIVSEFVDKVHARDVAVWIPPGLLAVMVFAYAVQRRRSLRLAALKDQILVIVLKKGWRLEDFNGLYRRTFAVGKEAGNLKLMGMFQEAVYDDVAELASKLGVLEKLQRFQGESAKQEFENKIHGYLYMEKEPDFSSWNIAFDPLRLLFRPYDPHFVVTSRHTIDPELYAFVNEGIEPRQYVRQRPGTDDLVFRRRQLWVSVVGWSVGLAAPAVWATLVAISSGWTIALNTLATALLLGIPIRWNYQILIKKRGFPKGVRLMEAGRTLLLL